MESLNIGTKISNPHPAESHIAGQCSVSSPLVSRVSGDGEEATRELPKTNDATHVHVFAAGGRPNVTSDQREEKALTSKSDKTLFVQKSEPPSVSTSEDKKDFETKQLMHRDKSHFDSTNTEHTQSANQFDNSETSVNLVNPRPTTPELASYNESGENNMFTVPSTVLNTAPDVKPPTPLPRYVARQALYIQGVNSWLLEELIVRYKTIIVYSLQRGSGTLNLIQFVKSVTVLLSKTFMFTGT